MDCDVISLERGCGGVAMDESVPAGVSDDATMRLHLIMRRGGERLGR